MVLTRKIQVLRVRAKELGWLAGANTVRIAVSKRALDEARSGVSNEVRARRTRDARLTGSRRDELEKLVDLVLTELTTADERRYVIDRLRASIRGEQRRPADIHADAERLGWSVTELAKEWGVARTTAHRWVDEAREGKA